MNLIEELHRLLSTLESHQVKYALCGGLAMAVYAFPRATLDIDIMIDPVDLDTVKSLVGSLGYTFDSGLMVFKSEAIQIYRLVKIENDTSEELVLDLLLVSDKLKDIWNSRVRLEWEYGRLSVVSPEGLIQMKSMRKSCQDQDDIRHLRSIIDED